MKYLICYDVSDNKCRRQVAQYLESVSHRIQYSVFLAECSAAQMEYIKKKLLIICQEKENVVLTIAPLCQSCSGKMWQFGKPLEEQQLYVIA